MKKVAIIGTVPNTKIIAPYKDTSWDIWVCSPGNSQEGCPERVTEWYELHGLIDMQGWENRQWYGKYCSWLAAQSFPVWMQERNEDVPKAMPFPLKPLLDRWGKNTTRANWFTSSICYMMAFAMYRGYEHIAIYGVDMAATEEHYSWQKAGIHRFIEFAHEAGVKVSIPLESTLAFDFPLYGYADATRMGRGMIIREFELNQTIAQMEHQEKDAALRKSFYQGAREQLQFDRRTYVPGVEAAEVDFEDNIAMTYLDSVKNAQARSVVPTSPPPLVKAVSDLPQPAATPAPTLADFPDLAAPAKPNGAGSRESAFKAATKPARRTRAEARP